MLYAAQLEAFSKLNEFAALPIDNRPFIGGKPLDAVNPKIIEKSCPADGAPITPVVCCSQEIIDHAVTVAHEAYLAGHWRRQAIEAKKATLFRLAALIEADTPRLAYLDALETGRPYGNFLRDSIPKAVGALRWFTEAIDKLVEEQISRPNSLALISREALGVVGIITPWNDPLVLALWKLTPALLMGNSVVLKPAEQSSFSTLRLAMLAKQAGLPDGILNVVTGDGETGQALACHPLVRGIFFTGSSETGKKILTYAGQSNMKKVGLECGGKSPFIVSQSCGRLEQAAATLASRMFYNQGQICSAPSRLIVHRAVKGRFLALLERELPKFVPGNPFSADSEVGSLVSLRQYQRVRRFIDEGSTQAVRVIQSPLPEHLPTGGYYIEPTILVDMPRDTATATEEIFGPVLVTHDFDDLPEAIQMANDSRFGLAASIWTDDLNEALVAAREIEAGIVHINSYGDDDISAPFGGIKESGIGKDKSLHAFDDYSTLKTTWINLNSDA